jgi:hypothetical protein
VYLGGDHPNYFYILLRGDLRRDEVNGVRVCIDLILSREGGYGAIYNRYVYSLKRLACVTFPGCFEEKKEKTKYT